jgi:hypothetical protein
MSDPATIAIGLAGFLAGMAALYGLARLWDRWDGPVDRDDLPPNDLHW